jgi:hypothetical protein
MALSTFPSGGPKVTTNPHHDPVEQELYLRDFLPALNNGEDDDDDAEEGA